MSRPATALLLLIALFLQCACVTAYGATSVNVVTPGERSYYPPVPGSRAPVAPLLPQLPGNPTQQLSHEYVLGPGDILTIIDYGVGEGERPFVQQQTIAPDGTIVVNPVGVMQAAGHTLRTLNDTINSSAAKYIAAPEIRVSLAKGRSVSVYVLGDVERPGLVSVEPDTVPSVLNEEAATAAPQQASGRQTAARTTDSIEYKEIVPRINKLTVLTAIQLAGGLNDTADVRRIRVTRGDTGQTAYDNLWALLAEGDVTQDVELRPGDSIFVAHTNSFHDGSLLGFAADRSRRVRVWGGVKYPGVYELKPQDDLYSVIAKAGGFTEIAISSSVLLSRLHPDGTIKTMNVALPSKDVFLTRARTPRVDVMGRTALQDGDVVIAAESAVKKALPRVTTALGAATAAAFLLYLSRNVKDRSQSQTSTVRLF